MKIRILQRKEINDKVWNGCVHFAINAMPYAYTWYLDNICEEWEGLVLDEYKAVMPLVFNKKFGISYLYQPFFAQQLGVFTSLPITKALINAFIEKIPSKYKYIDVNLNEINDISESKEIEPLNNYLLDLNLDYALLKISYSKSLRRKLKKADKNNLVVHTQLKVEDFVAFYMQTTGKKINNLKEQHIHILHRIIYKALSFQMASILGVYNAQMELIAANFILIHPTRIINLLPCSTNEGNELNAMPFLLDFLIKRNANSKKVFDFEGSMIQGVEQFYKSFGAEKVHYFRLKRNKLPLLLRLIKK